MNESNKLRTILLWTLLPIVCFACAILFTNWFATENSVQSSVNYKAMAWGKIIASSSDIVFQDVDSIKYYGWQKRIMMKKDSIMAADITHLFPESGVRKLTILDKGDMNPVFEAWNNNATVYIGWIARQKDGEFVLRVNEGNEGKIIPIGKFTGRISVPNEHGIDRPLTTMNVVAIVTLLLCVLGFGFVITSENISKDNIGWLFYVSVISSVIPLAYVILWILGWWKFEGSLYNYPEWIALSWLISEIGLLSGVIYRLYETKEVPAENIFEHNFNKLKASVSPQGEWKEVGGTDSLIINDDGTLYYSTSEETCKLTFQIADNGSLIAADNDGKVVIVRYEVHPASPSWLPIMRLTYCGKTFTKDGRPYESAAEYYVKENKKNEVLKDVIKCLRLPEKDGSWGWAIVSAAAVAFIGKGLLNIIPRTVYNFDGIIGVGMTCAIFLFALYGLILNLWLISSRKRKVKANRLFSIAYPNLRQPELTEYIRAALKQSSLSVDEWKEQNKEKCDIK